jgi:hypothetical protein
MKLKSHKPDVAWKWWKWTFGFWHDAENHTFIGIDAVNVGLHEPRSFSKLILGCQGALNGLEVELRFHVQNIYRQDVKTWEALGTKFRYWKMNDCDRANEERVIITDWKDLEEPCQSTTQSVLRIT